MTLIILLLLPFVIALVLLVLRPAHAKEIALGTSVLVLTISVMIAFEFQKTAEDQFAIALPWMPHFGINFSVALDGISLLLVLLTTVLTPLIIFSSFSGASRSAGFYGLVLLMQAAMMGVFVARDGFLFYVLWEMALVPIWFICLIWGDTGSSKTTFKFFVYTLAGSLFMLIALVYVYLQTPGTHSFAIQDLYTAARSLSAPEQSLLFWGLFLAFAIKMPIFPLHTWQPDTYRTAPAQGSMLLSAIMLKMGIYGVIRWLIPLVPLGVQQWGFTALVLSVIGIVYASLIALQQDDFKRLIAYSSIAHVGLISAGVFTLSKTGLQGALIQMLSHGLVVFALFFIAEIIFDRTRTRKLSELGGIRNAAPQLASVFLVVLFGSVALPFTSGFVGEFLLITSLVKYQFAVGAVASLTIILGAAYMLRAFQRAMLGEVKKTSQGFIDLTWREKIILFPVVILIIYIGVQPGPLMDLSEAAADNLVNLFSQLTASAK